MAFEHVAHRARCLCGTGRVTVNTKRVGTHMYHVSVSRGHAPCFGQTNSLCSNDRQIIVYGSGFSPGYQGAVRFVRPVHKGLRNEFESVPVGGQLQFCIRHAHETRRARGFRYHPGNDIGKPAVRNRIVVKCAVRLDMRQPRAELRRDIGKSRRLSGQGLVQSVAGKKTAHASETLAIRVPRMGTYAHAVDYRGAHRRRHRLRIARVPAASNVAARYYL